MQNKWQSTQTPLGHQQNYFYFVGINSYVFHGKLKQGLDKFRTLFLFELFLKNINDFINIEGCRPHNNLLYTGRRRL